MIHSNNKEEGLLSVKAKIDEMWMQDKWNFLKQVNLVIGLVGMIIFLSGSWGAWATTPVSLDDSETVMRMIVKANAKMDLKTLEKYMAADEDTMDFIMVVERKVMPTKAGDSAVEKDLTGLWEIQEEDRVYQATLNAQGNGPYNWQEGRIQTEKLVDRLWSGTWHQKGNDREGGFEVLLSEDGKTAEGAWWYLRVGSQKNIPPREWGGTYKIKRLSP
jgi:hypothetical protein